MSNERFTQKAEEALNNSLRVAERLGASYIGTEHILLSLCEASGSIAARLLFESGVVPPQLSGAICECEGLYKKSKLTVKNMTPRARRVLDAAAKNAMKYGAYRIGTEHILLAILEEKDTVGTKLLTYLGVDIANLREKARQKLKECEKAFGRSEDVEKKKHLEIPHLLKYGKCLSDPTRDFSWEVVGRENIIERVIRTLLRKTKNNPVLLGEAGVGKTAIVEGLAMRIAAGNVPPLLSNTILISLDLTKIVAGTKYRGDFEERIRQILDECKKNPQVVLFIDELHTVIGTGAAEGAVDLANIIKPELSRAEIRVIGATTQDEYRRHIEKDSALERRFQPIVVEEPSVEDSCTMMRAIAPSFEKHHGVLIDEEAITASVELSTRYMYLRYRPDKCIDLLDEACACVAVRNKKGAPCPPRVTRGDLLNIISEFSGQQDFNFSNGLTQQEIFDRLNAICFGQKDACLALSRCVVRSRSGVGDPSRPLGVYFFYGESGVGKTKMAKTLSSLLFLDENACITLDMSEYSEPHSVSKLVGAPQGYLGYGEGGILTDAVKKHPYSIVLFDEIEKAHRDVYHLLLQILDEGRLTDSTGKKISFRNTYVIFTSNVVLKKEAGCGFLDGREAHGARHAVLEKLKKHFPVEFLSRMDDYICFNTLGKEELCSICRCELEALGERLRREGVSLRWDHALVDYLVEQSEGVKLGARPIKTKIRAEIESQIADILVKRNGEPMYLRVSVDSSGNVSIAQEELVSV